MKKYLALGLLSTLLLTSCSENSGNVSYEGIRSDKQEECLEPENPYNDDGGHDAGFKWAQEKGETSCNGNSDSFNEGCAEYGIQLEEYNKCVEEKQK